MSDKNWTPGPWKRNGSWILSDKQDIAQMFTSNCTTNGDLIAAAPDLYAALEYSKEVLADQIDRFHKDCRCQLCESLPMMIDNALRKARGEAA